MDPITLIVAALAAGAASGGGAVAAQAIQDAYNGLKGLIARKFADKGGVQSAVASLESKPESPARQAVLAEELETAGAAPDRELVALAQQLLDLARQAGLGGGASYTAALTGSGAIAQGPGAVAAGERGVAVGGNVFGGIVAGDRYGAAASPATAPGGTTALDEAASLHEQRAARAAVLAALERQAVLASGAEAARLQVQIAQEQQAIRRLEDQLDALQKR